MKLIEINKRWIFYVALLVFIVVKIPHLSQAFYWDESWVYAPAVYHMYEHGPSLMPDAIPVVFSRGHPLLFHAACAGWMHLFGYSHFSMHCFALAISVILAIALFEIMLRLFNYKVALMSGMLLLLNVSFYVGSSLVLTDVALTLFAFLSLYYYAVGKYVYAIISLSLLYYMKESSWVMAFVIFADLANDIFFKKTTAKTRILKCLTFGLPLLAIFSFFILQKNINGWYLYPDHTGIVNFSFLITQANLQKSLSIIFYNEHVYGLYILMSVISMLAYLNTRRPLFIWMVFGTVVLYLLLLVFGYKDLLFHLFTAALIISCAWFFMRKLPRYTLSQERFIKLTIAFSLVYIYFCGINFYESRYLFPALFMISVVLLSVLFDYLITASGNANRYVPVLGVAMLIGLISFHLESGELELDERLDVQQHMIDFFEEHQYYDENICCFPFLGQVHLLDPKTGFLHSDKRFIYVTNKVFPTTDFVVFDSIEPSEQYEVVKNDKSFSLAYGYQKNKTWVKVYQRNRITPGESR